MTKAWTIYEIFANDLVSTIESSLGNRARNIKDVRTREKTGARDLSFKFMTDVRSDVRCYDTCRRGRVREWHVGNAE